VVETDECGVSSWTLEANPFIQGHQPGQIPEYISKLGAKAMICGGMGSRAISFFDQFGIQTAMFSQGTAGEALAKFLAGELGAPEPCSGDHHDHHGHAHSHKA
jgi:predicted Fe-Mo cluster-binding NifX family protein